MQIDKWLPQATQQLTQADIPTARLDSLILLEDAMGIDRARILAHPESEVPAEIQIVLTNQLARRAKHEPLAYIRGKSEFYGREFIVSSAVLEPRPESETIIELLMRYIQKGLQPMTSQNGADESNRALRIADVGTGSGALGITAALELPKASVELLEIDAAAIKVAQSNVIKFTAGVTVLKTDLLDGSSNTYDILLCNLPYVPDDYDINTAARHEPGIALFGGVDGIDLYRKLFGQIQHSVKQPLLILCESLPAQHSALRELAATHGYIEDIEDDFIQAFVPATDV